jgi:hypothetical protein
MRALFARFMLKAEAVRDNLRIHKESVKETLHKFCDLGLIV